MAGPPCARLVHRPLTPPVGKRGRRIPVFFRNRTDRSEEGEGEERGERKAEGGTVRAPFAPHPLRRASTLTGGDDLAGESGTVQFSGAALTLPPTSGVIGVGSFARRHLDALGRPRSPLQASERRPDVGRLWKCGAVARRRQHGRAGGRRLRRLHHGRRLGAHHHVRQQLRGRRVRGRGVRRGLSSSGLGVPFACGDASCWSGSQFCGCGFTGFGPACVPMPCRCGALPTCSCLFGCPFEFCVEDAGALYQSCSCP